jgi:predicted amidohydrolase YtcJ
VAEACEWSTLYPRQADASRLTIRGVKLFADGGYSSRNAATRTPYLHWCGDPDHACGRVSLDADEILDALRQTNDAGLQLAVHANGERAQDVVCAAVRSFGPTGLPVRVEHAGNVLTEPGALAAWGEAGIVPIPQPVFLYNFGAFLPTYLGDPLQQGRFPFRTLLEAGWRIPGSSDCHLGCEERQTNPMFGVWCCVARRGFHGEPIGPEESVDVVDALRMHTLFAAEALGQEAERGSLEPGKRGDVVVLDRDPRQVAPDDLADVQVDFVFVDGQLAFAREGAESPTIRKVENGQ